MKRSYSFEWYVTKEAKYGEPIIRHSSLILSYPTGETKIDAKNAVELFTRNFGNLHKNTIIKIKEFGEKGQIGEDIIPSKENYIVPTKKK